MPMTEKDSIGARIRAARRAAGLSQEDLGDAVECSRQAVNEWEKDLSRPNSRRLGAISEVLRVSLDYLGKGTGKKPKAAVQFSRRFPSSFRRRPLIEHFERLVKTGALDDMLDHLGYTRRRHR